MLIPLASLSRSSAMLGLIAFLGASPVLAASNSATYYQATLVKGPAPEGVISSGMGWQARGDTLQGTESGDQPWMVCAELAQNVGTIGNFVADGKPLTTDKLDYCNKKARKSR